MARKSTKRTSPAAVKAARTQYNTAKRAYHNVGEKAFGKPGNSVVKRDYKVLKREYKRAGALLGRLTGRKPRRSR